MGNLRDSIRECKNVEIAKQAESKRRAEEYYIKAVPKLISSITDEIFEIVKRAPIQKFYYKRSFGFVKTPVYQECVFADHEIGFKLSSINDTCIITGTRWTGSPCHELPTMDGVTASRVFQSVISNLKREKVYNCNWIDNNGVPFNKKFFPPIVRYIDTNWNLVKMKQYNKENYSGIWFDKENGYMKNLMRFRVIVLL